MCPSEALSWVYQPAMAGVFVTSRCGGVGAGVVEQVLVFVVDPVAFVDGFAAAGALVAVLGLEAHCSTASGVHPETQRDWPRNWVERAPWYATIPSYASRS